MPFRVVNVNDPVTLPSTLVGLPAKLDDKMPSGVLKLHATGITASFVTFAPSGLLNSTQPFNAKGPGPLPPKLDSPVMLMIDPE